MTASREVGRGAALARASLAGNPSDAYGGAVLATTLGDHAARVEARRAPRLAVRPASGLVRAAVRRFARQLEPAARSSMIEWGTSIPRGVGLGGSSAIVIATVRALCELYGVRLDPSPLADFALAVEREELGIAAGPQDRVAQAHGGLMFMDFAQPDAPGRYEQLESSLLPPLLVAWRTDAAQDSGPVHGELRRRFEHDPRVQATMAELAAAARGARAALVGGDLDEFGSCVDASFNARRRMMPLDPRHVAIVEIARDRGAAANYAGSGGAIVAVCRDEGHHQAVGEALSTAGCAIARER